MKVNKAIMKNEIEEKNWPMNELAKKLYDWVPLFNKAFFEEKVSLPILSFEKTQKKVLGHFQPGYNSFGAKNQINLNKNHLDRAFFDLLITLVHEMTHSWEFEFLPEKQRTTTWCHKKGFINKLNKIGIICNNKGQTIGVKENFILFLKQNTVDLPKNYKEEENDEGEKIFKDQSPLAKKPSKATSKKWSCGCQNIRVGTKEFQAKCLKCNNVFKII